MEMEMIMRAGKDVEIGQDITPSLPPLSSSLYDSFLHSHCSSCFSPLPQSDDLPTFPHLPLYCSPLCSSSASPIHSSSAELHLPVSPAADDSSDLRAALRFLLLLDRLPSDHHRLAGLLTNHHKFITNHSKDDEILTKIRGGARAMAVARSARDGTEWSGEVALEEAVLCLVITNAVEVQDSRGCALGIGVYDGRFSWINHSCSPNACYRFVVSGPQKKASGRPAGETRMKIFPSSGDNERFKPDLGSIELEEGCEEYGPRVIVRSIKRIKEGEEVTVTYTDLLRPKAMRESELWLKYHFICRCRRCSAAPLTYVDRALQETYASSFELSNLSYKDNFDQDEVIKIFNDYIDDVINDYLSVGDPASCCKKLETMLTLGILEEQLGGKSSQLNFRLYPLHHLSLNAYTILASAYKSRATDLLALNSEIDKCKLEAFHMSRASAAYCLLLAGATHHLFQSESSLIASVANFWSSAGESLLTLAKSSVWSLFVKLDLPVANLSSLAKYKCSKCSLIDRFKENLFCSRARNADLEDLSKEFLNCVSYFTKQAWSFLIHDCGYFKVIKDPIDFSWLATMKSSNKWDFQLQSGGTDVDSYSGTSGGISGFEAQGYTKQVRISILELGFHCLLYGGVIAHTYYGQSSHLICEIQDIMNLENNLEDCFHEIN